MVAWVAGSNLSLGATMATKKHSGTAATETPPKNLRPDGANHQQAETHSDGGVSKPAMRGNKWFKDACSPIMELAQMLVNLDRKDAIPSDMRDAIAQHAENAMSTLPGSIAAISAALASAIASDVGLDPDQAAHAAWGIQSVADMAQGMNSLREQFATPNTIA
jgi:uncharacterized protein (UPF0147 family)